MKNATFEILDNGVYRAYWRSNDLTDIAGYAKWFMLHYEQQESGATMRILHDYRETDAPSVMRMREYMKDFKMRNDVRLRVAHIYSDTFYPLIMNSVTMSMAMSASRKFFKPDEEDDAITWLLGD